MDETEKKVNFMDEIDLKQFNSIRVDKEIMDIHSHWEKIEDQWELVLDKGWRVTKCNRKG